MAVLNTPAERARLYFKYRPARVLLAADPEAATHQAFRLPAGVIIEDESATSWPQSATMGQLLATRVNPTGELPEPQNVFTAMETLNKKDGFEMTDTDQQIAHAHGTQTGGHFLSDKAWSAPRAGPRAKAHRWGGPASAVPVEGAEHLPREGGQLGVARAHDQPRVACARLALHPRDDGPVVGRVAATKGRRQVRGEQS